MSGNPEAQDKDKGKQTEDDTISVTVTLGAKTKTFTFPADDSTVDDLTDACEEAFEDPSGDKKYNWATHKFIAPQPVGLIRGAEQGGTLLSQSLAGKKVRLMASRLADVDAFHAAEVS
ncbi:ubiquitin/metalloprotease fusion protein, partial [Magnaporthiopsis poae ATCC 64411]